MNQCVFRLFDLQKISIVYIHVLTGQQVSNLWCLECVSPQSAAAPWPGCAAAAGRSPAGCASPPATARHAPPGDCGGGGNITSNPSPRTNNLTFDRRTSNLA